MRYIKERKNHFIIFAVLPAFICIAFLLWGTFQKDSVNLSSVSANTFRQTAATESKSRIVAEIRQLSREVAAKEEQMGQAGPEGYKVYSPRESAELFGLYQGIATRLDYLNHGWVTEEPVQWEGYTFDTGNNVPFTTTGVQQAIASLAPAKLPPVFLKKLRIFLLPYSIPEVSGLGGAGYLMLSARPVGLDLIDNQLTVTLYHEIGHHVHMQFMPENTAEGRGLWLEYLKILGGTWHGPGKVNTAAWSNSSEENFAEDFRMLFGNDQPYFGDMALGDPRVHPREATALKTFIKNLGRERIDPAYQSPWIPQDNWFFWQYQTELIAGLWMILVIGFGIAYHHCQQSRRELQESRPVGYGNYGLKQERTF